MGPYYRPGASPPPSACSPDKADPPDWSGGMHALPLGRAEGVRSLRSDEVRSLLHRTGPIGDATTLADEAFCIGMRDPSDMTVLHGVTGVDRRW